MQVICSSNMNTKKMHKQPCRKCKGGCMMREPLNYFIGHETYIIKILRQTLLLQCFLLPSRQLNKPNDMNRFWIFTYSLS